MCSSLSQVFICKLERKGGRGGESERGEREWQVFYFFLFFVIVAKKRCGTLTGKEGRGSAARKGVYENGEKVQ
jgi:hypothetical protein